VDNKVITHVSLILVFALILPILGAEVLTSYLPEKFVDIAMHALFESIGGFVALSMSAFLYYRCIHDKALYSRYVWVIIGLSSMGIFDLFHAVLEPGNNFVWLHSLAVFSGGIFFSMIWFSQIKSLYVSKFVVKLFILLTLIISVYTLNFPQDIPKMLNEDGTFSTAANILNFGGGLFFIIATVFFIKEYKKDNDEQNLLFIGHTLLFGIAGLLFNTSALFDAGWWFWHALRLMAYMFAQSFIVLIFLNEMKAHMRVRHELKNSNLNLHEKIGLALTKQQAQQSIDAKLSKMVSLSAMISLISNQFRTPLKNMHTTLMYMKNKNIDTQIISTIEDEVNDIESIIEDFLKLHQVTKENKKQSLRDAIEASIDIMSPLLQNTPIDIQTNYQCLSRSKNYDQRLTHGFIYIFQYLFQKPLNPEVHKATIDIKVSERVNNKQEITIHENFSFSDEDKLYNEAIDNKNPLSLAKEVFNDYNNTSMNFYTTMAGSKIVIQLNSPE